MNFGNHKVNLGEGSAGTVYKGVLPSGQIVAIKHIYKSSKSDTFTSEVEGLSRIRHSNLVCLFGWCVDGGERYLVYEYCSYGNLAQHLSSKSLHFKFNLYFIGSYSSHTTFLTLVHENFITGSDNVLSWDRRVKILRDCALALRFLHSYPDGHIVHRDIKATKTKINELRLLLLVLLL